MPVFLKACLSVLFVGVIYLTEVHAGSTELHPVPAAQGAAVDAVAIDSAGTAYAFVNRFVYRRKPKDTWRQCATLPSIWYGFTSPPVVIGNSLFAVGSNLALESTDGGESWHELSGLDGPASVTAVKNVLYSVAFDAVARKKALYRSSDTGKSWDEIYVDSMSGIRTVSVSSSGSIFLAGESGIFVRHFKDTSFIRIDTSLHVPSWSTIYALGDSTCIAVPTSGYGHGPVLSTNFGDSWQEVSTPTWRNNLYRLGDRLCILGNAAIFASSDTGRSWSSTNFGFGDGLGQASFAQFPNGDWLLGTLLHLYLYESSNSIWREWDDSLFASDILAINPTERGILIVANSGIFRSVDGQQWQRDSTPNPAAFGQSIPNHAYRFELLKDRDNYFYYAGLRRGPQEEEWSAIPSVPGTVLAVDSDGYIYSKRMVSYNMNDLMRSSDKGETWEIALQDKLEWSVLSVDPSGRLLAGASGTEWPHLGYLMRSEDHGSTWRTLFGNDSSRWWPTDEAYSILANRDGHIISGYSGYDLQKNEFCAISSSNDGATWNIASRTFAPLYESVGDDGRVYLTGNFQLSPYGTGVCVSEDGGQHWSTLFRSRDTIFNIAVADGDRLWVGTRSHGLFTYPLPALRVSQPSTNSDRYSCVVQGRRVIVHVDSPSEYRAVRLVDILGRVLEDRGIANGSNEITIELPESDGYGFLELSGSQRIVIPVTFHR